MTVRLELQPNLMAHTHGFITCYCSYIQYYLQCRSKSIKTSSKSTTKSNQLPSIPWTNLSDSLISLSGSGPNQDPVTLHATRRSKPIQNIKTLTLNLSQNPGQWHKQKPPVQFHEPLKISKTKRIKLLDSESFEKFPTFADGGYILNSEPEFKW